MFIVLLFITCLFGTSTYIHTDDAPLSLREIIDNGRTSFRRNNGKGSMYIQLEAKSYFSDGIVIENEDIIINGV